MEDKFYFYDYKYWTLEEIKEIYNKLSLDKGKLFRESLSYYTLAEILMNCNYDRRMIHIIFELAGEVIDRMNLTGTDCGRPLLGYDRRYKSMLRKLINLGGELVFNDDDIRINKFKSCELFLNNLICLTIGHSYEKDIIDDLVLIDYNVFSKEESLAIADNFGRFLKNEELVFYNKSKELSKKKKI